MNSESTAAASSTLTDGDLQALLRRFRQFSTEKPVFVQSRLSGAGIIRPPYKPSIGRVLGWLSHHIT
jgi:hypothetical protein